MVRRHDPPPTQAAAVTISDLIAQWSANETWRPIASWPQYEVSSFGSVRRADVQTILALSTVLDYFTVCLFVRGRKKTYRVNRLVASAFLGPSPFPGALVAHNDGSTTNNIIGNLRWASDRENQADRGRHNTRTRGSDVFGAKLKEVDIPVIRSRISDGERYPGIAKDYGVSVSTISLIKKGKIWRSAGGAAWRLAP